jgi:LuxR family transcriptional regulator, maltose regulon positive regulatory protein
VSALPSLRLDTVSLHPANDPGFEPAAVPDRSVLRQRLVDLLGSPDAPPIAALFAPPGYGKTTLLVQWAKSEQRPVAWLTLTELDNDPVSLLTRLIEAYRCCGPVDDASLGLLPMGSDRLFASVVPRLLAQLSTWQQPPVLILDDVQSVTDRAALDLISVLLHHLPAGSRVALAGRSEPLLPLARLRASRMVLDIGVRQLALDVVEATELARCAGITLRPEVARELTRRTEGWAAGIYLAVLAGANDGEHPAGGHVSGADHYIAEYLRSEVGRTLTADDLTFLSRTSILDLVTPGSAIAVSGLPDAGPRLERLTTTNLLVGRVAGTPDAYRYHTTLREYLRAELDRREPSVAPSLHAAAATHYAAARDGATAVSHAFESDDILGAARHLADFMVPLYQAGHSTQLKRWLDRIPAKTVQRVPMLAVLGSWLHLLDGTADKAELYAEMVDGIDSRTLGSEGRDFAGARLALRAVLGRRGLGAMLEDARGAFDDPATPAQWRAAAGVLLAFGLQADQDFDVEAAETILARALAIAPAPAADVRMSILALQALTRLRAGDVDGALAGAVAARTELDNAARIEAVTSLVVLAADARIRALAGDHAGARTAVVRAQLVRPLASHASPWQSVPPLLDLARAYLALSDPGGAQTVIRQAEDIVRRRQHLGGYIDQLLELRRRLDDAATTLAGSSTLTAAELRVLSLLPTYLSFEEIGERLSVSRNTVKTHAMSIYGKLWASSRGEAVERAVDLGLLEPYPVLRRHEDPDELGRDHASGTQP